MSVGLAELVSYSRDRHRKILKTPSVPVEAIESRCLEFGRSLVRKDGDWTCTNLVMPSWPGQSLSGQLRRVYQIRRSPQVVPPPAITDAGYEPNAAVSPSVRSALLQAAGHPASESQPLLDRFATAYGPASEPLLPDRWNCSHWLRLAAVPDRLPQCHSLSNPRFYGDCS